MHILVYQNDRSRNASSDRKMNHIILLVNVQTFQKYNYYYYFLFIGCNHKMWFQGDSIYFPAENKHMLKIKIMSFPTVKPDELSLNNI